MTDEQLRQLMLEGKGKMPPNKKLDDEKIRNLTVFLRDLVAGNPETGRAVADAQAQPLPRVDTVFQDKCSACHGPDGTGRTTIGKSLKIPELTSAFVQGQTADQLARVISQGNGRMPAYANKFNPVQIGQLVSYIRTLTKNGSEKEPVKGEESHLSIPQPATIALAPSPAANRAPPNASKEMKNKAPEPKPAAVPAVKKAPLIGQQLYIAKCFACHSSDGSGMSTVGKSMKIPSLTSQQVQEQSDEILADVISNGVGKMPAYRSRFSEEQIQLLVAYIRELGKKH